MAEQTSKKAATKNQHYVPQFYQRYFSIDGKNIGTFNLGSGKIISAAPIKHQSSGDYFYSANQDIEDCLGFIESKSKIVIESIVRDSKFKLTKEEKYILYTFILIQAGRTLAQSDMVVNHHTEMCKALLRDVIECKRNSGNSKDLEEIDGITEEIINSIHVEPKEPGLFRLSVQAQMIKYCIDLEYKILINNTSVPFVTSDNPASLYNQFMERINQNYALGSKGAQFFMPLTDKIAVILYDKDCYKVGERKKMSVSITSEYDICEINKLTSANAYKNIYYKNDGSVSECYLKTLLNHHNAYSIDSPTKTFSISLGGTKKITGASYEKVKCRLNLSFVKELDKSKAITELNFNPQRDKLRPITYFYEKERQNNIKDRTISVKTLMSQVQKKK